MVFRKTVITVAVCAALCQFPQLGDCGIAVAAAPVSVVADAPGADTRTPDSSTAASRGGVCGMECVECWFGGPFENDCDPSWEDDGLCDCGCQFSDASDCGIGPGCTPECDFCWIGEPEEGNCNPAWENDGECDCGCQFSDECDCAGINCSIACDNLPVECDYCWIGEPEQNNCDPTWENDSVCDCGCQFSDSADCDPRCVDLCDFCWFGDPEENNCDPSWENDGFCDCGCQFDDDADCSRCADDACDFCWIGDPQENNCPVEWAIDGDCDCGCQFIDNAGCDPACVPGCDFCWFGTAEQNNCDPAWENDGTCDCGCQFSDTADCGTAVACTTILSADPPDCAIDARQPHPINNTVPSQGFTSVEVTIGPTGCDVGSLAAASFTLTTTPGAGPTISDIAVAGEVVTVNFSGPIPTQSWSCVRLVGGTGKACLGLLPGDVSGSLTANAQDITALINALNNVVPRPIYATDTNRDLTANAQDIIQVINLLNGASAFEPWINETIPACPP